jgi:putative oxidoreductase
VRSIYAKMQQLRPYVLSVLRIVVGLLFLQHGLSKLFGFPVPGPAALSGLLILAAILESVGSLLLIAGAYTRIVALLLSGEMAFAYFMAHAPHGFYPIANSGELAVLFSFVFLYIAFAGGGVWSVDRLVLRYD